MFRNELKSDWLIHGLLNTAISALSLSLSHVRAVRACARARVCVCVCVSKSKYGYVNESERAGEKRGSMSLFFRY